MKTTTKRTNKEIELAVWQLFALIIAAIACLFAIVPFIFQYRLNKCDIIYVENINKPQPYKSEISSDYHKRYVREVDHRDQCGIIPPLCSATTTITPIPTVTTVTTTRSTPSTVSVTRPTITNFPTTTRTTTPDPWANTTRPYNSWRLPDFAVPIDYSLYISCPNCFTLKADLFAITFTGQATINIDILSSTRYLVLHAKNLNITQAKLINGSEETAIITYLPEFEMIHLNFPSNLSRGDITLQIDYTGQINEHDQTGFFRETFWIASGALSYLLAGNFQPIHARTAFPCFDEPNKRARFTLTLEHPQNSTIALSNTVTDSNDDSTTTFNTTHVLSSYSLAWAILPSDEFEKVSQNFSNTEINIWIRRQLNEQSNTTLDATFEIVTKTLEFIQEYLNVSDDDLPRKIDLIGVPNLIFDEKASATWGLILFREEFLSIDTNLNSAETIQATTKIIAEHILQMWFLTVDWWDAIWFDKSMSSFLAYKAIEDKYQSFNFMEQFPIREMVPLMMEDFKPSIWPISIQNLANNEQILDYLSIHIYSKGASLLRLIEYVIGEEALQTAVRLIVSVTNPLDRLNQFYKNFDLTTLLNTTITVEDFLRSWLDERNYPIVTVSLIQTNDTNKNTTISFRQSRYIGSSALDNSSLNLNYIWKIYMECDVGGLTDEDGWNLTTNVVESKIKFIFDKSIEIFEFDEEYLWIKCNKDFYSYHVTEYIASEDNQHAIWSALELVFNKDIFSNNDRANLLNDAFILPHGGDIVTYDQTINLIREMFSNPSSFYIPWSVFVWHWNYLMGVEEHSKYFYNFKQFATRQILAPYESNIDNIVTVGTNHQDRLLKSMFFELLCRVQNPDALNKATELYQLIPSNFFINSNINTNIPPDYLSTVLYYHMQNTNDLDEWENLWSSFTDNEHITSQQRTTFLRALSSGKEVWQLKLLLELAADTSGNLVKSQEFFDIIISISQNPNGRDVIWNFYRHNYAALLNRFGNTNHVFNQLISNIAQSFENKYYYSQMVKFVDQYPNPSRSQQLAIDQILINSDWLNNGMAQSLDAAISAEKSNSKKNI